ncbi:molybdate transport system ATP-binding protein [Haloferula luteola]|uniref:Molybdate transport system ATP-binding protein n=1 Tax=Haloferula luteola TaxID=595692 RepID=A0A840V3J8_9BACT|nr:ABC transporter ATP-binding protein [Haloferula luteola]MBB5352083.1 molybdate transport system ATP-binding protein [Haloferula luteola]
MIGALQLSFSRRFPTGAIIQVDDFLIPEGRGVTILFGESGAGKSTLIRVLAGLEKPDDGRLSVGEEWWFDTEKRIDVPASRRRVGWVSQDGLLFPHLSVAQNVSYGMRGGSKAAVKSRVADWLERMGLGGMENRRPSELSGGQQQRVALARALASDPALVLLDEPWSGLDRPTRERLRSELRPWLREAEVPVLMVTHDRQDALALGDRMAVMSRGRLVEQGEMEEVFCRPESAETAQLLEVETLARGRVLSCENGVAEVDCRGVCVVASEVPGLVKGGEVWVCVRGGDVSLGEVLLDHSSLRNQWWGRVVGLRQEGVAMRVELDVGFPLVALLTAASVEVLGVTVGREMVAAVKAQRVHVIPL